MSVTEVEKVKERNNATNKIRLDKKKERALLAGAAQMADGVNGDTEAFEELQERLKGYKLNSEREIAWVRRILLPEGKTDEMRTGPNEIGIEFLLPSGDTFWRTYRLPDQRWPDDNKFVELLDEFAVAPSTLETLPGESIDITYQDGKWKLVGLEVSDDSVGTSEHADEWNKTEEQTTRTLLATAAVVATPIMFLLGVVIVSLFNFSVYGVASVLIFLIGFGMVIIPLLVDGVIDIEEE